MKRETMPPPFFVGCLLIISSLLGCDSGFDGVKLCEQTAACTLDAYVFSEAELEACGEAAYDAEYGPYSSDAQDGWDDAFDHCAAEQGCGFVPCLCTEVHYCLPGDVS